MVLNMILTYNNKIVMSGNKMVTYQLPDNTLLFKFGAAAYDPSSLTTLTGATWTRVSAEPNIWLWDARGVETVDWTEAFRGKFSSYDSSGYVDIIGAGELNMPAVIGMKKGSDYPGMFRNNGNALRNVCYLSFPNAERAQCLFQNNGKLLRVEGLNLPKVTTFQSMFKNCTNLESIGSITSSPSLTNCSELFQSCQHLITFPWFDTSNVESISGMFNQCQSLQTIPLIDTNKITNMSSMFLRCYSLTSVPLLNTSNVTIMQSMFYGCKALTNVPLLNTSKVTNLTQMFLDCTNVQSGALALYQQASSQANPPTKHTATFKNCGVNTQTGLAELAQIPTSWGGTMA